ncbi:MAG: FHA domain-containing protein, partial [Anaerolineae bacterium]|nr:FHA domain-containing protein [Anaerolineae bacterium]
LSGDTLSVTDLGSTNGTFVNGERIRAKLPCRLNSGDEIRFGDRFFRVQIFVVRDVNWEN